MRTNSFINRCIRETLSGIRDGLSLFTGESRAAVIFCLSPGELLYICDPQNLLRGYEPRLQAIYLEDCTWCLPLEHSYTEKAYNFIRTQDDLQLDGLISYGGSSSPVYYQMWFTEHHPNLCSLGPTHRWLEHAVLRFSHDIANGENLYTGISGNFLREYSSHAVHDYIVDKTSLILGMDARVPVYPILDIILLISKTNEEGVKPYGSLSFVEPKMIDNVPFLTRFKDTERPLLNNAKHVRKLLQAVEHSERSLISDGTCIVGISAGRMCTFHIEAKFHGKFGFLRVDDETICSFQDGSYSSDTHRARLVEVEEALLDIELSPEIRTNLFKIVSALVHNAEEKMFGCTFVLDLAPEITKIAGQSLHPPLDLKRPDKLSLAAGLSKVDGALHIRNDLHLYGFACLLDGYSVPNEDRARGARYNSALRFTAKHQETIVVVVSADRPVSIFQMGKEMKTRNDNTSSSSCSLYPTPLQFWLEKTVW